MEKINKFKYKKSGYTLVEMILVMAIISVLALIAVPMLGKYSNDAEDTGIATLSQSIYTAASMYDNSHYNSTRFDENGIQLTEYTFSNDELAPLIDTSEVTIVELEPANSNEARVTVYRNTTKDEYVVEMLNSKGELVEYIY